MAFGYATKVVVKVPGTFLSLMTAQWIADTVMVIRDDIVSRVQLVDNIPKGQIEFQQSNHTPNLLDDGRVTYYPKLNIELPESFVIGLNPAFDEALHQQIADSLLAQLRTLGVLADVDVEWHMALYSESLKEGEVARKVRLGR